MDFGRALDALVGGGMALLVSSLLLPVNPLRLLTRERRPGARRGWPQALEQIAEALTTREPEAADAALLAVARADGAHDGLVATLEAAGEAARLSPQRRGALGGLDRYAVAAGELRPGDRERARARARRACGRSTSSDAVPPEAVQAIEELAAATRALKDYLDGGEPEPAREAAMRAAALANAVLEATGNLSAVHIVGQIRLAAVDLLRAAGWSATRRRRPSAGPGSRPRSATDASSQLDELGAAHVDHACRSEPSYPAGRVRQRVAVQQPGRPVALDPGAQRGRAAVRRGRRARR